MNENIQKVKVLLEEIDKNQKELNRNDVIEIREIRKIIEDILKNQESHWGDFF